MLSSLALDIRFGYAGYRWDQQLNKYHARHRVYDPFAGRWLNRDPADYADSLNLYEYVTGAPIIWRDPSGLGWFKDALKDGWDEFKDLTGFGNPDKDYKEMMDRTNQMQLEIMLALCLDPADFHDLTDFQELDAIRAYQRKRTKETAKDILETIIPLPGPSKFRIIKKLINKSKKLKKFLKRGKKLCKLIGAGTFTSAGKGGCSPGNLKKINNKKWLDKFAHKIKDEYDLIKPHDNLYYHPKTRRIWFNPHSPHVKPIQLEPPMLYK